MNYFIKYINKLLGSMNKTAKFNIYIPKFMKGIVKSTACSLSYVMVISPIAKSAF